MNRRSLFQFLGAALCAGVVPARVATGAPERLVAEAVRAGLMTPDAARAGGVRPLLANSKYDTAFWRRVRAKAAELSAAMDGMSEDSYLKTIERRREAA